MGRPWLTALLIFWPSIPQPILTALRRTKDVIRVSTWRVVLVALLLACFVGVQGVSVAHQRDRDALLLLEHDEALEVGVGQEHFAQADKGAHYLR